MSKVIGIDVSMQTFDVSFFNKKDKWEHFSFSNDKSGFKKFEKLLDNEDLILMEATGPYFLRLATYFNDKSYFVSVVNPLKIKYFSKMQMMRAKTDKKDAQVIAQYGMFFKDKLEKWKSKEKYVLSLQEMNNVIDGYHKQLTMMNNRLKSFEASGFVDKKVKNSLKSSIKKIQMEIEKLEKEMLKIVKEHYQENYELLISIPGLGKKTAIMLIVLTGNFERFENYKQLISYVGFSPRIEQSGTSLSYNGHISKMGNSRIRKLLYMCSWSAKKYNKQAVEMYQRLSEKGKPERVIKIAIANKLLKIAFAVVKNKTMYDANYNCKLVS